MNNQETTDVTTRYQLRIHAVFHGSTVNGPGIRSVVHTQGCTLDCPGCFNPRSHPPTLGLSRSVDAVFAEIMDHTPDGVTISGGEPTEQLAPVTALLNKAHAHGLSTLVFSGRTLDEIRQLEQGAEFLTFVDVLVDGRFDPSQVDLQGWTGSRNQCIHFLSARHRAEEFGVKAVEFKILPTGNVQMSGYPARGLMKGLFKHLGPIDLENIEGTPSSTQ